MARFHCVRAGRMSPSVLGVSTMIASLFAGCGGGKGHPDDPGPGHDTDAAVSPDAPPMSNPFDGGPQIPPDGGLRTADGAIVRPEDWIPDDVTTPRPRLIARFNFDGQYPLVPDLSGFGNHAHFKCVDPCENGPPPLHPGYVGYGVELAWWQHGMLDPSPSLNGMNERWTVAFWIQRRIHYGDERSLLGREADTLDGTAALALSQIGGRLSAKMGKVQISDTTDNPLFTWVHVAARFDGAALTLFRNGAPVVQAQVDAVPSARNTPFYLGTRSIQGAFTSYADCIFDEILLFDHALSDAEIADLAQ